MAARLDGVRPLDSDVEESVDAFVAALTSARASGRPVMFIGGGTNLIVSGDGFRRVVLRYRVSADAGAVLKDLVDFTFDRGLKGLETAAGIPGSVGGRGLQQRQRIRPFYLRARGERALLRRPPCASSITAPANSATAKPSSKGTRSGPSFPPSCGSMPPMPIHATQDRG